MRHFLALSALCFALPAHAVTIYQGTPTAGELIYGRGLTSPERHFLETNPALGPITVEATTTPGLVTVSLIELDLGIWPGLDVDEAEGSYATQFHIPDFSLQLRWEGVWEITAFTAQSNFDFDLFRDGLFANSAPVPVSASATSFFGDAELNEPLDFPNTLSGMTVNLSVNAIGNLSAIAIEVPNPWYVLFHDAASTSFAGTELRWSASGYILESTDSVVLDIVPEPTTALLLATGLAGLAAARRRRS